MEQNHRTMPTIALGARAWGNDGTFGTKLTATDLRPVLEAEMDAGLNFWDTAYVYGMGTSEKTLGEFLCTVSRENYDDTQHPFSADSDCKNTYNPVGLLYLAAYYNLIQCP